jgi:streptogramin lyase
VKRRIASTALVLAASAVLAACSSGSHAAAVTPPALKTTPVQLSIVIPLPRSGASNARRPAFVSPGTVSGGIAIGPVTTNVTQAFDLSASSGNCSSSSAARTCTVTVNLPIGSDQIALVTYDGPLASGKPTGHQLATATVTQTIVEGKLNTVTISLLGIPASATIVPQTTTITALGTPVTVPLTVSVYDASGNQITGTDPFAQRVLIAMSPVDVANGGNFTWTVNGNTTGPALNAPTDQLALVYPGTGGTGTAYHLTATTGAGNTPIGTSAEIDVVPGFALKQQIFSGGMADTDLVQRYDSRDIWITEPAAHKLAMLSSSGTFVEYPVPSGKEPRHIVYAGLPGGGQLFISEFPDTIGRVALNGTISETTVPTANAGIGGMTWDGAHFVLYFAESAGNIGTASLGGSVAEYPTGIAGSAPAAVALNNLAGGVVFTDPGTNAIGFMDTSHTVTEVPIPTANAGPSAIAGATTYDTWFAEANAAKLGHIDNSTHTIVEYPAPDVLVSLVPALADGSGAAVWALTRGGVVVRFDASGGYTSFPDTRVGNGTPAAMTQGYSNDLLIQRAGVSVSDLDAMFY